MASIVAPGVNPEMRPKELSVSVLSSDALCYDSETH